MTEQLEAAVARLHKIDEAAALLRVHRSTLYGLIDSGQLQSVKIGRSRRVPESAIASYIDGLIAAQCS
ncbi:helix-turn-helix domain-containing protein [Rhodococcus sp. 1.20]|uniref:helix-turn-helix domain-containing protein n=1 Tax=Rhodococcus sp. 311R TaxID=1617904 RepID=UPI00067F543F|nr:helix-turn-helix domain-containing protein [Rhodococcus sp. 311R]